VFDVDSWLSTQPSNAEGCLDIQSELSYLKVTGGRAHSIYFTPYRLTDSLPGVLDVWIDGASFRKFDGREVHGTPPRNDLGQSYWNGAFSFQACVLRASDTAPVTFLGAQEQALAMLYADGIASELQIRHGFEVCQRVRMVSRDVAYPEEDLANRQLALWDIALANGRFGIMNGAIQAAADTGGATLTSMLEWMKLQFHSRVRLKSQYCRQLFVDHRRLEPQQMEWTMRPILFLVHVRSAFQGLLTHPMLETTGIGEANLQRIWDEMQREFAHLQVLNWFVVNRLIPHDDLFA